jgi:protein TonB
MEPEPEPEPVEVPIFTVVEEMPSFPGGEEALYKFLAKNTRYPDMAKDAGVQGIVYLTFVIEEDGSINDVRLLRGIGGGCDEEAIRVMNKMPKWSPGKQRGRTVRVQYNMPFRFTLAN